MNRIDDGADGPDVGRPTAAPHVHDPFEVTIQMDGIGRHLEGAHRPRGAHAKPQSRPPQEPADGPVFVDESGRRGRHLRRIGLVCGLAFAGYAAVVVATLFSGNSSAPWLPLPGPEAERPATVDAPGLPEESAGATDDPGGTTVPADETAPAAGTRQAPDAPAGTGAPADGPAGTPGRAETGTDPEPTATTPAAPDPNPSGTRGPVTPVDPPSRPEETPAESEAPPGGPETPPADGGGTVPQARSAATAPHPAHTLARTAPPEENQAA
ncbi:hypothetical protein [Streptomyces sp. BBFR102]|uniref:hypothetical protein n=1 Tax=Streptomyces sp. BBFR102 TaxID=3448171 RepID=UPI003F535AD5